MQKILLAVAAALACVSTVLAQSNNTTNQDDTVAQGKALGSNVAGQLRGQAFQIDANGEVKKDANGNPITQQAGQNSMRDAGRMFQSMTGTEGVDRESSAARGRNSAGRASVRINQSFDFSCSFVNPRDQYTAGGLVFRVEACLGTLPSVQEAQVAICENALKTGICANDVDFPNRFRVTNGAFSDYNGLQIGLGCNSQARCRMTVTGSYRFGGNDAELKQQAQQVGANADQNGSMVGSLRQAVTEGDYAGKMQELGRPILDCAKLNENGLANGEAKTCDGSQSVAVASGSQAAATECPAARCIRQGTAVQEFKRSCTRTFPLTVRTIEREYGRTATCEVTRTYDSEERLLKTEDSCIPPKNPDGTPSSQPAANAGMALVGSNVVCEEQGSVDTSESTTRTYCRVSKSTDYYVDFSTVTQVSQVDDPAPVGGACDTNPLSETRSFQCEGVWFGRTLPADQCTAEFFDESTGAVNGSLQIGHTEKAGCGFCTRPKEGLTCYAVPANKDAADNGETNADAADSCEAVTQDSSCTLTSSEILEYSGEGGLVTAQKEVYTCRKENTSCLEYEQQTNSSCLSANTFGLNNPRSAPQNDASFNAALVAAATVDGTAKGIEGTQADSFVPKLFGGTDSRCQRPTGGIGQLLSKNCCRTNLERPKKGNIIQSGCDENDVRLAAARRANYTYYVGDYCSRRMRFPRRCLERKQTYCVFPGVLARLVQEQGRVQLDEMARSSSSADSQKTTISFPYYHSGTGAWTSIQTVNGVQVAAWQHPSYCADPGKAQEILLSDPTAKSCPGVVTVTMASCSSASGCGDLPTEPEEGSADWSLTSLNPLENVTTALNRYSVAYGACSTATQNCSYEISAYPAGKGGKALVSKDLTFQLFAETGDALSGQEGTVSAQTYQMNNMGDLMFKGFSLTGTSTTLPATVRLDFSKDGGQTWTTHNISTDIRGRDETLPGSDVKITGYCDLATNICGYRLTGTAVVTAKPWGSPQNPDCSGFTPGQLAVLDFGKMDLSEWLASVMDKDTLNNSNNPSALVQQANTQLQNFNAQFSGSGNPTMTQSRPNAANFARAVPGEGFGPFDAKLVVSGMWPEYTGRPEEDKNDVMSVEVDWGDCSPVETLIADTSGGGRGFRATHRYEAPNASKHTCLKSSAADTLERNIKHTVTITAYTKLSGKQTATLKVENAWSKFPGASQNNAQINGSNSASTNNSGNPPPPQPPRP